MSTSQQNDASGSWWHSNQLTHIERERDRLQRLSSQALVQFQSHVMHALNEKRELVAYAAEVAWLNSLPWDADPFKLEQEKKAVVKAAVDALLAKFNAGDPSWLMVV